MPDHPAVAFHLRGHIDAKCTGWLPPHVFIHGAALKDPDNIFNAELEGNKRRGGPFVRFGKSLPTPPRKPAPKSTPTTFPLNWTGSASSTRSRSPRPRSSAPPRAWTTAQTSGRSSTPMPATESKASTARSKRAAPTTSNHPGAAGQEGSPSRRSSRPSPWCNTTSRRLPRSSRISSPQKPKSSSARVTASHAPVTTTGRMPTQGACPTV